MSKKIVILLLVIFIGSLFFPVLALAGNYKYGNDMVHYEGLVPCGKATSSLARIYDKEGNIIKEEESPEIAKPCEFCHLFVMLDGIIDFFMIQILPPVVVLMMVIAGIMFFFAGGNPALMLQAKKLITSVVIGVVIIFSAYLIVGTVLTVAGVQSWTTLDKWLDDGVFIVDCPIGGGAPTTPIPPTVPASDYTTEDECVEADYYWYDGECHEEEKEGEWISANTDIGPDNVKVLTLSCPGETKLEEGKCEPDGNTHVNPGDSKPYGDNGWYCEFTGDRGGRAMGEIFIYCVPE